MANLRACGVFRYQSLRAVKFEVKTGFLNRNVNLSRMVTTLSTNPSRDEVLEFVSAASTYGNLGLFIGAGFSMAVLPDDGASLALPWGKLLDAAAKKMKVEITPLKKEGVSYPQIATALCSEYAESNDLSFQESATVLKRALGAATAWYPDEPERSEFAGYLKSLAPAWIVTTNYDLVLECLLSGRSVSLGPNDAFSCAKGLIPIFHLHGARTAYEDIIITQEDYVALFRPAEYRQIRLALAIKESTTCLLGYGLGDVNVLTALDWSKNVYEKEHGEYPHEVIQVYRTAKPSPEPYRTKDGIVIIEVKEISEFCKEYADAASKMRKGDEKRRATLAKISKLFVSAEPSDINRFIDDDPWRRDILRAISLFSVDLVAEFESFLGICFKETRRRSGKGGAFQEYATDLHITLDLLTAFTYATFPPALFPIAAKNLDRLANYIGTTPGNSYAANDVWNVRRGEISAEVIAELKAIAREYRYPALRGLLKGL